MKDETKSAIIKLLEGEGLIVDTMDYNLSKIDGNDTLLKNTIIFNCFSKTNIKSQSKNADIEEYEEDNYCDYFGDFEE